MKFWKSNHTTPRIDFCERCGSVCDARCQAEAARSRAVERASSGRFGI
jgi:hypothetical protein